jgi:hypothetical protein
MAQVTSDVPVTKALQMDNLKLAVSGPDGRIIMQLAPGNLRFQTNRPAGGAQKLLDTWEANVQRGSRLIKQICHQGSLAGDR